MTILIPDNSIVLFQGDSITDAERSRTDDSQLGTGYAMFISAWLSYLYPEKHIKFINKGISGNRVKDLKSRWTEDCIALNPSILSILIGINDTWRRYDNNDPVSAEEFESDYRFILNRVKKETSSKIILLEPFLIPTLPDRAIFREDLDPKIAIVRKLAYEFNALLVPLDGLFVNACSKREPSFWAQDGVHPTSEGHVLIAKAWLDTFKSLYKFGI